MPPPGGGLGGPASRGGLGGPRYAPPEPIEGQMEVRSTIIVTIREKTEDKLRNMVAKIMDLAAENGGTGRYPNPYGMGYQSAQSNQGPTVEWFCENTAKARREAIKKAVDNALADAQAAAGQAKLTVHETTIAPPMELPDGPSSGYGPYTYGLQNVTTNVLQTGSIPVEVRVRLTCSY